MLLVAGLDVGPAGMRAWVSDVAGQVEALQERPAPTGDVEVRDDACRELLVSVTEGRPALGWLGLSVSGPAPDLASRLDELEDGWGLPADLPVVRSEPERLLVVGAGGLADDVVTVVLGERRSSAWRAASARRDLAPEAVAAAVQELGRGGCAVTVTSRADRGGPLPAAHAHDVAASLAAALGRPVHLDPERDALVLGAAYVVAHAVGAHAHRPALPDATTG